MDATRLYQLRDAKREAFDKAMEAFDATTGASTTTVGAIGWHSTSTTRPKNMARLGAIAEYTKACQAYVEAVEAYDAEHATYVPEEE